MLMMGFFFGESEVCRTVGGYGFRGTPYPRVDPGKVDVPRGKAPETHPLTSQPAADGGGWPMA